MAQQLAASITSLDGGLMVDITATYQSTSSATSFDTADVKKPFAVLLDTVTNISTRYNLAVWTQSEIDAINANTGSADASWNQGTTGESVGAIKLGDNLEITGLTNGRKYLFTQIGSITGSVVVKANVFSTASHIPVGPSNAPTLGLGDYNSTGPVLKVYMTLGADNGAIPHQMRLAVVDASDTNTFVDYLDATEIQAIRTDGYHQIDDASQVALITASAQKDVTVTAAVLTSSGLSSSIAVKEYELRSSAAAPTLESVTDVTESVWDFEAHSNTTVSVGGKLKVAFTATGQVDSFEIQTHDTSGNADAWGTIQTIPYVITHGATSGAYVYEIDVPVGSLNEYRILSKQSGKNDGVSGTKAQYDLYNPKLQMDVVEKAYTNATKMHGLSNHDVADYNEYEINFVTGASNSYEERDISLGAISLNAGQPGESAISVDIFATQAKSASPSRTAQCEAGLFTVRALVATADLNPADLLVFELESTGGYTGKFPAGIVNKANEAVGNSQRTNTNPTIDVNVANLLAADLKANSVSIPAAPVAPTSDASNVAVYNGNGEGVITWEDINLGNGQPASFIVELFSDSAMTGSAAAYVSTTTEYAKVVGLTNGYKYYIRITSINAAGSKVTNVTHATFVQPATTYTAVQISNVTLTEHGTTHNKVDLQFNLPALSDSRQEFTSMSVQEIDAEGKYIGSASTPTLVINSHGGLVSTTQKHEITTHTGIGGLKQFFITCTAAAETGPTATSVTTLPYFISVTVGSKPEIGSVVASTNNYKTYVKVTVDNCGNQITDGSVLGIPADAGSQFGAAAYTGNTSADLEFFSQSVGSNTEVWTATLPFIVFEASGGDFATYTHISNSKGTDSLNDIGISSA